MADFKVVSMRSSDIDIPKFEEEVKKLVVQGWIVVSCAVDSLRLFAFLVKK
jgi:hypothetical protein